MPKLEFLAATAADGRLNALDLSMVLYRAHRRQRCISAFSVIETVIGMLLFGISVLALHGTLAAGYSGVQFARENLQATQIIVDKFEAIRLYSWEQINDPTFIPRTFEVNASGAEPVTSTGISRAQGIVYRGRITISDPPVTANYADRLKLVTVELTWITGNVQRRREMSTLVGLYGLYTHVY